MAHVTEELNFKFYVVLIHVNLRVTCDWWLLYWTVQPSEVPSQAPGLRAPPRGCFLEPSLHKLGHPPPPQDSSLLLIPLFPVMDLRPLQCSPHFPSLFSVPICTPVWVTVPSGLHWPLVWPSSYALPSPPFWRHNCPPQDPSVAPTASTLSCL